MDAVNVYVTELADHLIPDDVWRNARKMAEGCKKIGFRPNDRRTKAERYLRSWAASQDEAVSKIETDRNDAAT